MFVNNLDFARLIAQLDGAVPVDAGGGASKSTRRGRGQVFTPAWLADVVCELTLGQAPGPVTVLDPAAGDGAMLAAAARRAPSARLIGWERDAALVQRCRDQLPTATVHQVESLFAAPAVAVDAVIANPPYIRSIRLRATDPDLWSAVRGAFIATSRGEWDLYGAFIERSLTWVRPGGRIGLIVPSRWLTAQWAQPLRAHLAERGVVRTVIDLGAAKLFATATTYTSIVILEAEHRAQSMTLVIRRDGVWRTHQVDVVQRAGAPWIAPGAATSAPRRHRASVGLTVGDVTRIAKGTGTNADGVFVLVDARREGGYVVAGDTMIEADAARPCVRGRDVGAEPIAYCLLPYRDGRLLPWAELAARWPRAAAYLASHRVQLEARERGRFRGDRFHAFGRPQNLQFLLDATPKVIVPDVVREPRAWLDAAGVLVLDSAYALRPRADAPAPWNRIETVLELMRSPELSAWLARASVPLRGDYRRIKTRFLAPMPLP